MRSRNENFEFKKLKSEDFEHFISLREGEVRLGELIMQDAPKKFVVFGVKESVGPQANLGFAGAHNGFDAFLSKFLNIQSTSFLYGSEIRIGGSISSLKKVPDALKLKREQTAELDDLLLEVLTKEVRENEIPIIIGGGHNNAYSCIKHASKRYAKAIDVINLDPHADYRKLEGRHSGNSFSYAFNQSYLAKYTVLGLHQNYNSQEMIDRLKKDAHTFTFFEDYLFGNSILKDDVNNFVKTQKKEFGIELDLDAIIDMPSSAITPSGVSLNDARNYLNLLGKSDKIAYIHITEGAPNSEPEKTKVGKAITYLVTDIIKSINKQTI